MGDVGAFFAVMAALSAAVQTLVEHPVKKNPYMAKWFDRKKDDHDAERWRHISIHGVAFVIGAGLAASIGLTPLAYLGVERGLIANAATAGVLVSFGGSFFDEALGAVREFKKAQEGIAKVRDEQLAEAQERILALQADVARTMQPR